MNIKLFFSIIWILLSVGAYLHYYYSILKGQTKPHMYTRLTLTVLLGISFGIQFTNGGGFGAYVVLIEFIGALIAFLLALKYGEKHITSLDTVFLSLAFLSLLFWIFLHQPVISMILIICTDVFALLPTYRKCFSKPYEETIIIYLVSGFIFIFSLLSIDTYTFLTIGHQLAIILIDWGLTFFILIRRYQLTK